MRTISISLIIFGTILLGVLLFVLFSDTITLAARRAFASTPSETGDVEIVLTDYEFTPKVIKVKAGQQVQFTLRNTSRHTHEFMVGRQVHIEDGITEPPMPDFFEGIQVNVTGNGMPMGFDGMEDMAMEGMDMSAGEGMPMGEEMQMEEGMPMEEEAHQEDAQEEEGMSMDEDMQMEEGMPMEEEAHQENDHAQESMPMGEEMLMEEGMPMEEEAHREDGQEEEGMSMDEDMQMDEGMPMDEEAHTKEGMQMEENMPVEEGAQVVLEGVHAEGMGEMDDHHGAMVMLDPARESTITLTIPEDKVGTWVFGCFQENGLHFDDGMKGLLIVQK